LSLEFILIVVMYLYIWFWFVIYIIFLFQNYLWGMLECYLLDIG